MLLLSSEDFDSFESSELVIEELKPFAAVVIESLPNLNPCDELLLDAVDPKLKPEVVLLAAEPLVEVTPNLKPPPGAMLPRGLEVVLVSS